MKLVRSKKAWQSEIATALKNEGIDQAAKVAKILDERFTVLSFKPKEKQNPLWRLTILFFFLFFILVIVSFPFKYLITGVAQYRYESKVGKLYRNWMVKLGL